MYKYKSPTREQNMDLMAEILGNTKYPLQYEVDLVQKKKKEKLLLTS